MDTDISYLGKFHHDLITTSLGIIGLLRSSPFMAELFRLVNYYDLPRYMGSVDYLAQLII